jgi:N6-L-threonylcarbamoyladenine synthase
MDVIGIGEYRLLGDTLDDAAGEAFDKTAKLLGLGYPGGPALARLAESGNPRAFRFSRPMTDRPSLDFSFSGLKTQVLLATQRSTPAQHADIARGFEEAVVDTLVWKCLRALDETGRERLVVAGGVGANVRLRERLHKGLRQRGASVYFPRPAFCTDNGAMIALAGALRLAAGEREDTVIRATPRRDLATLTPPSAR